MCRESDISQESADDLISADHYPDDTRGTDFRIDDKVQYSGLYFRLYFFPCMAGCFICRFLDLHWAALLSLDLQPALFLPGIMQF